MLKSPSPINCYPHRMLTRLFVIGAFSALGLLSGIAPDVSGRFGRIVFSSAAYAQDFSNSDITKFARAALPIEIERRSTQQKIKSMTGGNVPKVSCDRTDNLGSLPENARNTIVDFCKFSTDKIKQNGLDVAKFNAIKTRYDSDAAFRKLVNKALEDVPRGKN